MTEITENEFDKSVIQASKVKPVFLRVGSDWCQPCHAMEPALQAIENDRDDVVDFVGIDADNAKSFLEAYGVFTLPSFLLFDDGFEVDRVTGVMMRVKLLRFIDDCLNGETCGPI